MPEAFFDAVDVRSETECWPWLRGQYRSGYGQAYVGGKRANAHRHAYEICGKTPVDPEVVRHVCDNKICCNPLHLLGGTSKQNTEDAIRRGLWSPPRGEKHGMARLTDEEVRSIKLDCRTQRVIAEEYGISQSHVSNIKNGVRRAFC